jgi:sulfur carrier protein ThiS
MAKIPLAIDKNYCSTWGVFEGCREFLQNAKDADEDGYKMTIEHFPRTSRLEISNAHIYVDPAKLLILGKSDKTPGEKRGQFGEGFVLGTLALIRKGHDVKFVNGDLSWTVAFEQPDVGHPFEGQELLTFKSRKISVRETSFKVEVEGITTDIWAALRKLFLFLDPPKPADTHETQQGTLLLAPELVGKVFSRGIFVRQFEDLSCGYDMKHLTLDRDRRMVDEWDLHYKLGHLWQEVCKLQPELAAPRVYEMAKANAAEVRNLKYHADEKLLKSVRDRFEAEHSVDASPVTSMAAAKEAESIGAKPVVVSTTLKELLEKGGLSAETVAAKMEGTVEARFAPADLTLEEREAVDRLEQVVPAFAVVTFRGTKFACRLIDENSLVGVERRMLTEPFKKLLTSAVAVEAKRRGVMPLDVLLEHVAREKAPPPPVADIADHEVCDECGKAIPGSMPSMVNMHHHHSCSLHTPSNAPADQIPV